MASKTHGREDIAIVAVAQTPSYRAWEETEQLLEAEGHVTSAVATPTPADEDAPSSRAAAEARGWQTHLFDGPGGWAGRI